MQPKKTLKADLSNKRGLFFQIGLCVSLLAAILFFAWSQPTVSVEAIEVTGIFDVIEMPPIVKPPEPESAPSAPKVAQLVELINIVHNDVKVKEIVDPFNVDEEMIFGPIGFEKIGTGKESEDVEPYNFMLIEDQPLFQGKDVSSFRVWISNNLDYPEIAKENGIQGRVTIQFVIDKNGNMTDIEILASPDRSLSEEAIRILKTSPQWTPGKQRGRPVPVKFAIPVDFRLQ